MRFPPGRLLAGRSRFTLQRVKRIDAAPLVGGDAGRRFPAAYLRPALRQAGLNPHPRLFPPRHPWPFQPIDGLRAGA
jgi:hypothetical protein